MTKTATTAQVNTYSRSGVFALVTAHIAGMLDLVALPIWVGALIGWFRFDPQQAGLLVSLFLAGQVVSSVVLAPRFNKLNARPLAVAGFLVSGLCFAGAATTPAYAWMAVLHVLGGLGAGCALSVTHGTIGRSGNPHRLFAVAQSAVAVSGILLLGGGSKLLNAQGGAALFALFAAVLVAAALIALAAFPASRATAAHAAAAHTRLSRQVWFGMFGIGVLTFAQAMMFSFVERLGMDRGYGAATVSSVLIAVGFVNLIPGPLAAWMQHRVRAENVVVAGPLVYAAAVLGMTYVPSFPVYAVVTTLLVGIVVFTHTFLFGALARLDASGRAVAATPAMLMIGSAIGPVLGGTIVKHAGYGLLGTAVAGIMVLSAVLFLGLRSAAGAAAPAAAKNPA